MGYGPCVVYTPASTTEDMTPPAVSEDAHDHGTFVRPTGYSNILWSVSCPSWCTSFDVSVYVHNGPFGGAQSFVTTATTVTGVTEGSTIRTLNNNPTALCLTTISGTPDSDEPFIVTYQGFSE